MSRSQEIADRILRGALAGFVATVPMSAAMLVGRRFFSWGSQQALPPEKITHEALRAADWHDNLSPDQEAGLVAVNHFAYGSAMGGVYSQLFRPKSATSAMVTGAGFGLAVWAGSYCGWLPAVGLYPPPTKDTAERTALMIGAHVVWGGTAGLLVHWLARRRQASASQGNADLRNTAGDLRDVVAGGIS